MISFRPAARAALLPLCLLAFLTPATAFETYKVIGVTAGDKLTIRSEPEDGGKPADWKEVGSIAADAKDVLGTGRSKLVGEQRWIEVSSGGYVGWVNSKFLEGSDDFPDLQGETFHCSGTEPFWSVTLGPKDGDYEDPESKSKLVTDRVQAATARRFPLLYRLTDAKGQKVQATVSHQNWCSDGMSDYDYAFQVLLARDVEFMEGCCVLKR
jgi:uncharacterized membrane protein